MLKRQKVLLALLDEAATPLSATLFVKLAFLLREDHGLAEYLSFYDFVPYRYGPFSFSLYRELDALRRNGFVSPDDDRISLSESTASSRRQAIETLPVAARRAVAEVLRHNRRLTQKALVANVYRRFPWYATRSELTHLVPGNAPQPSPAELAVYTVGYEGKSIDRFFDGLLHSGIAAILDVRSNPVSRKYGFAQRSMRDIAGKLGIEYRHFPRLGIASSERTDLTDFDSYQRLLDRYEQQTLPGRKDDIGRLLNELRSKPSALLCMEKDVNCCHRARLASVAAKESGLPVSHL